MTVSAIGKNRNVTLDILKLIASYMVVFIHFLLYGEAGYVVNALARFAVPVFFMTSGYFSYNNGTDKLKAKIVNIVKLYLIGFALHFCFFCASAFFEAGIKGAFWYSALYVNPVILAKFVFFNVPRSAEHLWFLAALIYVYAIRYFIVKRKISERICLVLAAVLLITHLILGFGLSSFGIVIENFYIRNFLLMGYPFFCFGLIIRKNEDALLERISVCGAVGILAVGITETVIAYFISCENELYIGSVLMAGALFILALKMKDKQFGTKTIRLADISTSVYLLHVIIGKILQGLISPDAFLWKYASPILICIVTTIVALLFDGIKRKAVK